MALTEKEEEETPTLTPTPTTPKRAVKKEKKTSIREEAQAELLEEKRIEAKAEIKACLIELMKAELVLAQVKIDIKAIEDKVEAKEKSLAAYK